MPIPGLVIGAVGGAVLAELRKRGERKDRNATEAVKQLQNRERELQQAVEVRSGSPTGVSCTSYNVR